MKIQYFIGLDMSKETFVLGIHDHTFEKEFANTPTAIRKSLRTLSKILNTSLENCFFCLEHTGLYSLDMINQLAKADLQFAVIPGLEIKRSLGLARGKSDFIDAQKIAEYAYLRKGKLKPFKLPIESITVLKDLLSLRAMHVRHRASYISRLSEQKRVLKKSKQGLFQSQTKIIRCLDKEINNVESKILQLIQTHANLKKYFDLITSVKGIGIVIATQIIVKTNCFTSFENWRKFACYCGTAPFPNQSGKMQAPNRINHLADKEMKRLLTLAARSASMHDPDIKQYVKRKLAQGKTKKNVTNSVRNKLLARVFSVAKRGTPYVILNKHAA